jgi:hypothetical protein
MFESPQRIRRNCLRPEQTRKGQLCRGLPSPAAAPTEAERATGDVLGGIGPLGGRKQLPTFVNEGVKAGTVPMSKKWLLLWRLLGEDGKLPIRSTGYFSSRARTSPGPTFSVKPGCRAPTWASCSTCGRILGGQRLPARPGSAEGPGNLRHRAGSNPVAAT